jgi:hypothetical protein
MIAVGISPISTGGRGGGIVGLLVGPRPSSEGHGSAVVRPGRLTLSFPPPILKVEGLDVEIDIDKVRAHSVRLHLDQRCAGRLRRGTQRA